MDSEEELGSDLADAWSPLRLMRAIADPEPSTFGVLADAFVDLTRVMVEGFSQATTHYRAAKIVLVYALGRQLGACERARYRRAAELLQAACLPLLAAWAELCGGDARFRWTPLLVSRLVAKTLSIGPGPRGVLQEVPELDPPRPLPTKPGSKAERDDAGGLVAVEPVQLYAAALDCENTAVGFAVARAASALALVHLSLLRLVAVAFEVHRAGGRLMAQGIDPEDVCTLGEISRAAASLDVPRPVYADDYTLGTDIPASRVEALVAARGRICACPVARPPDFPLLCALVWDAASEHAQRLRMHMLRTNEVSRSAAVAYRCAGSPSAWIADADDLRGGARNTPRELRLKTDVVLGVLQSIVVLGRANVDSFGDSSGCGSGAPAASSPALDVSEAATLAATPAAKKARAAKPRPETEVLVGASEGRAERGPKEAVGASEGRAERGPKEAAPQPQAKGAEAGREAAAGRNAKQAGREAAGAPNIMRRYLTPNRMWAIVPISALERTFLDALTGFKMSRE